MAYGYVPVRSPMTGHPTPNCLSSYEIADDYGTMIIAGDLVALHTTGYLINHTASLAMVGVFAGVEYVDETTGDVRFDSVWAGSQSLKSGTKARAYVFDDPNMVFKAQADQDTTALTRAQVGENVDTDAAAGNSAVKTSLEGIDSSAITQNTTGNFKLLGSAELDESWSAAGTVMDVYVMPNEHFYKAVVSGI